MRLEYSTYSTICRLLGCSHALDPSHVSTSVAETATAASPRATNSSGLRRCTTSRHLSIVAFSIRHLSIVHRNSRRLFLPSTTRALSSPTLIFSLTRRLAAASALSSISLRAVLMTAKLNSRPRGGRAIMMASSSRLSPMEVTVTTFACPGPPGPIWTEGCGAA